METSHVMVDQSSPARNRLQERLLQSVWYSRVLTGNKERLSWLQKRLHRSLQDHLAQTPPPESGEVPRLAPNEIGKINLNMLKHPVVFEGLLEDSKIVREWSFDFLRQNFADAEVHMNHASDGEILSSKTSLANMIDTYRENPVTSIASSADFFGDNRDLFDYVDIDELQELAGLDFLRIEVFLGGNGSNYHCAMGGNLFIQVNGEKKWSFVPPRYTHCMYPNFGDYDGQLTYIRSPVVSEKYEQQRERYPLYQYVPKYTTHLKPGDVLFNPAWWWHEVRNIGEAIGIPIRAFKTHPVYYPLHKLAMTSLGVSPSSWLRVLDVYRSLATIGDGKKFMLTDNVKIQRDSTHVYSKGKIHKPEDVEQIAGDQKPLD